MVCHGHDTEHQIWDGEERVDVSDFLGQNIHALVEIIADIVAETCEIVTIRPIEFSPNVVDGVIQFALFDILSERRNIVAPNDFRTRNHRDPIRETLEEGR
jgi:hypothetical protein